MLFDEMTDEVADVYYSEFLRLMIMGVDCAYMNADDMLVVCVIGITTRGHWLWCRYRIRVVRYARSLLHCKLHLRYQIIRH
jgi:hypothetical protein